MHDMRPRTDLETWYSVSQFYAYEANLLDDWQFRTWIDLLDDEVFYWMPAITNRIGREVGQEVGGPDDLSHYEEDKTSLSNRVKRLETGMAWAETPPGRTRHLVSNIVVEPIDTCQAVMATSAFIVWRSHLETDQEIFAGKRIDVLRPCANTSWKIRRREIKIDHATLTQKSLGIFF